VKLIYHGQNGPMVLVGNPGLHPTVWMETGVETDVDDDLAHALVAEYPGVYSTTDTPQHGAPKPVWQSYRESQGHDVSGLTKDELINLPDEPAPAETDEES